MPSFKPYDPANPFDSNDLGPVDPFRIPGTDWSFNPRFGPNMDDPDPRGPSRQPEPRVPGGDYPQPNPFVDQFDGPQRGGAPENPFSPEAQARIKEKHRREEAEAAERRRQADEARRQQLKKDLGLDQAPAKTDDRGDYPTPAEDPRVA